MLESFNRLFGGAGRSRNPVPPSAKQPAPTFSQRRLSFRTPSHPHDRQDCTHQNDSRPLGYQGLPEKPTRPFQRRLGQYLRALRPAVRPDDLQANKKAPRGSDVCHLCLVLRETSQTRRTARFPPSVGCCPRSATELRCERARPLARTSQSNLSLFLMVVVHTMLSFHLLASLLLVSTTACTPDSYSFPIAHDYESKLKRKR